MGWLTCPIPRGKRQVFTVAECQLNPGFPGGRRAGWRPKGSISKWWRPIIWCRSRVCTVEFLWWRKCSFYISPSLYAMMYMCPVRLVAAKHRRPLSIWDVTSVNLHGNLWLEASILGSAGEALCKSVTSVQHLVARAHQNPERWDCNCVFVFVFPALALLGQ